MSSDLEDHSQGEVFVGTKGCYGLIDLGIERKPLFVMKDLDPLK